MQPEVDDLSFGSQLRLFFPSVSKLKGKPSINFALNCFFVLPWLITGFVTILPIILFSPLGWLYHLLRKHTSYLAFILVMFTQLVGMLDLAMDLVPVFHITFLYFGSNAMNKFMGDDEISFFIVRLVIIIVGAIQAWFLRHFIKSLVPLVIESAQNQPGTKKKSWNPIPDCGSGPASGGDGLAYFAIIILLKLWLFGTRIYLFVQSFMKCCGKKPTKETKETCKGANRLLFCDVVFSAIPLGVVSAFSLIYNLHRGLILYNLIKLIALAIDVISMSQYFFFELLSEHNYDDDDDNEEIREDEQGLLVDEVLDAHV